MLHQTWNWLRHWNRRFCAREIFGLFLEGYSPGQASADSLPRWRTSSAPHSHNCKRPLIRIWVSKRVKRRKLWVRLPCVRAKHGANHALHAHKDITFDAIGMIIIFSRMSVSHFPIRLLHIPVSLRDRETEAYQDSCMSLRNIIREQDTLLTPWKKNVSKTHAWIHSPGKNT